MKLATPPDLADFPLIELSRLNEAAEYLRILAHPHRLRIMQMLLHNHFTVGELADACHISSALASGHLRLLERARLLRHERQGRKIFYRIAAPATAGLIDWIEKSFSG